jgi:hypothetical protein
MNGSCARCCPRALLRWRSEQRRYPSPVPGAAQRSSEPTSPYVNVRNETRHAMTGLQEISERSLYRAALRSKMQQRQEGGSRVAASAAPHAADVDPAHDGANRTKLGKSLARTRLGVVCTTVLRGYLLAGLAVDGRSVVAILRVGEGRPSVRSTFPARGPHGCSLPTSMGSSMPSCRVSGAAGASRCPCRTRRWISGISEIPASKSTKRFMR